ncbi:MAG TPA: DUF1801 domain-containing protein [Sphingobium sp.]
MTFATHEGYFETVSPDVRPLLEAIQAEVERRVPGAERCIAYQMPVFRLPGKKGRIFFYFAAFKHHVGIYPPARKAAAALNEALASNRGSKGNLSFPLKEEVPVPLIGQVALALAREYER